MTRSHSPSRRSFALAALLACTLAIGLAVPAPVLAGDNATIFYFDPNESEADAGETITLDLVASSHGDYVGDGIDQLSFTIEYDADVFTVTEVEHGPMLAEGDPDAEVEQSVEIDDENGAVTVEQERTPSGDGATATEAAATITLEVADDAPSTSETLEITDASAQLISGYPQASVEREATIEITGSDDGLDSVPGFTPLAVLSAIAVALALLAVRSRR